MATNDFLPFGIGAGANVLDQASWAALAARGTGFSAGVAKSAEVNKALRQASFMAAVLAQFIVDSSGQNVLDNGDLAGTEAKLLSGLQALFGGGGSVGATGWQKLPGGLIIQWGASNVTASGTNVVSKAIVFPTAFPTFCAIAGGNAADTGNSGSGGWPALGVSALTTTGFNVSLDLLGFSTFNKNTPFVWYALGY